MALTAKTFILMGRSGAGKGTQAKILENFLKNQDPHRKILHLETGARFRDFIKGDSYSSKLAAQISEVGGRQPDFLAVWNWAHILLEEMKGDEHIIIDGTPRSYEEALVFDTAMTFYGRIRPIVIYLDVSRDWSRAHIASRAQKEGRNDDQGMAKIERRLDWFETEVMRGIKFFEQSNGYNFIQVNGEQAIEKVAEEIQAKLVE